MPLLWVLRDTLGLTGTKFGCGMALCGACTVHINGQPMRSCVYPISSRRRQTRDHHRGPFARWQPSRATRLDRGRRSAVRLLPIRPDHDRRRAAGEDREPTDADIDEAMRGNICRCGTYQSIRRAVHLAAQISSARRRSRMNERRDFVRRSFLQSARRADCCSGSICPERGAALGRRSVPNSTRVIHVGSDDSVTLFIHKAEMGQGTVTSLSMLLAEELECDWKKIRTEFPGVDRAYGATRA